MRVILTAWLVAGLFTFGYLAASSSAYLSKAEGNPAVSLIGAVLFWPAYLGVIAAKARQ